MRKLSGTIKKARKVKPVLVLFNNIIDDRKLLELKEIDTLADALMGHGTMGHATLRTSGDKLLDQPEEWTRDELRKGLSGNCVIYRLQTPFENITTDDYDKEYSGPVHIVILKHARLKFPLLIITCCWSSGIIGDDYSVLGLIVDSNDIKKLASQINR